CVINVAEKNLAKKIVGIGNCSGKKVDKFEKFKLTAMPAVKVDAPLILECFANFECKLADARLINKYNFFIFEIVKAHVCVSSKYPQTIHY
ncbi:flavin reductase, partial [Klebsiella pneumoniae]|nr:flavin reductase [Klebsiella pneumoniae]